MTKFIYFDHWESATEYYRSMPLDYIKHPDFTISRSTEQNITSHLLNSYDVIIILRASSESHLKLIKLAKDLGKKTIIDYDDDPLHLPQTNPMYGTYEPDKPHTIKCLTLSDEIWVATEGIKKSFRLYNKNIHIIPNAHNDTIFQVSAKRLFRHKRVIMWRGGGSHIGDIYENGTTEKIIKTINGNKNWNFYWLGQRFEWIEYRLKHPNFYYNPGATTVQFYKLMQEINPAVFFYPLSNNLFNSSKSNCSWLESVYSGAAYFGNTNLPEFQKPGIKPLSELQGMLKQKDMGGLEEIHNDSWNFILENLLLSKVNLKRQERLEKYIK